MYIYFCNAFILYIVFNEKPVKKSPKMQGNCLENFIHFYVSRNWDFEKKKNVKTSENQIQCSWNSAVDWSPHD